MTVLCYIDTETTGLDPRIHQPYEVAWWREDRTKPETWNLPHSLDHADGAALQVGAYFDRSHAPWGSENERRTIGSRLAHTLRGVTLVGSNPAFDAAMLTRVIGTPVWHHRMIDVSNVAMVAFDLSRPIGLAEIRTRLVDLGHPVPEPDHTAEGDVRTTRAAYEALREIGRTP